ncbi:hypothetical protein BaRGS_00021978, partial [Batillaria attramentaria]
VELRFRGAARAKWREYVNEGMRRTEIEHEKEEIYFDDRFCLWGKVTEEGRWESREVLKRGRHLFPFQYKLPEGIPCSFEGPEASVRYTVHGLLARTSGADMTTQRHVTVLRDLDSKRDSEKRTPSSIDGGNSQSPRLSFWGLEGEIFTSLDCISRFASICNPMDTADWLTSPRWEKDEMKLKGSEIKLPIAQEMERFILPPLTSASTTLATPRHALEDHAERAFSSTCCRPGRVACSLSVLKRSYVPGETIRADVQMHNSSMRKSGMCRLQLKQLLTYGESFTRALVLQEVKLYDCIRPGQRRQWRDVTLHVPPTCPSRLSKCRVIDVRYCVAVEALFTDAVLYAAVPVTIVTVPERGIIPIRWTYKECTTYLDEVPVGDGRLMTKSSTETDSFQPKYKYYEEVRDSRKDRFLILKFRQSPGVRRRQLMGCGEPGESRTETTDTTTGAGESQA